MAPITLLAERFLTCCRPERGPNEERSEGESKLRRFEGVNEATAEREPSAEIPSVAEGAAEDISPLSITKLPTYPMTKFFLCALRALCGKVLCFKGFGKLLMANCQLLAPYTSKPTDLISSTPLCVLTTPSRS